ncbi:MAG: class I SAM-dependent methyltransferase [Flavobacteriales bacterium]|nr:class I SAM-dependent methyltransferase [Flavobacteriales bacterium]MCB9447536.1 class I SAM-dependent methyltransferase [Flavobacteriales bacterium]
MNWKERAIREDAGFSFQVGIYSRQTFTDGNVGLYEKKGGTDFASRAKDPRSRAYFDTPLIYQQMEAIFKEMSPRTVLDAGCGDGRAVIWLLENTSANIIAVDGSHRGLQKLYHQYLEGRPEFEERVMLVHSDMLAMPLQAGCCDVVWAFESLYYLMNDYEVAIKQLAELLAAEGTLINGETNAEFDLVLELLNNGPKAMMDVAGSGVIREQWGEEFLVRPLLSRKRVLNALVAAGFRLRSERGISVYPHLISFLRSRNMFVDELNATSEEMKDVFLGMGDMQDAKRVNIYISQKG